MARDKQNKKTKPWQRRRRRAVGCLTIFVMVVFGGFGIWSRHLDRQVEAAYDKIRAQGYPITPEELGEWYEGLPVTTDASLVLKRAFESYGASTLDPEDAIAYNEFLSTFDQTLDFGEDGERLIREMLDVNAKAITLIHEAAAMGPTRFELNLATSTMANLDLGHLARIRRAVRQLRWELLTQILDNQPEAALDTLEAMIVTADSTAFEPVLISQLVRISCYHIVFTSTAFVLNNADLSDDVLRRWQNLVQATTLPSDVLVMSYVGERCMAMQAFDDPAMARQFQDPETRLVEQLWKG